MTIEQLAKELLAIIDSEMYVNDFGGLQAGRDATTDIHAAMAKLQEALAQTKQEQKPVAWVYTSKWRGNERFITRFQTDLTHHKADKVWPLYTSPPPQRQPLTLDFYDAGLLNDFGGGNVDWWQDYIRAELNQAHDFYQSQAAQAIGENT